MPEAKTKPNSTSSRVKPEYVQVFRDYSIFALKAFVGGAFGALGSKAMGKVMRAGKSSGKIINLDDHRDAL